VNSSILGIGTALPAHYMEQEEAALTAALLSGHSEEDTRKLSKLYRITGIDRRYSVLIEHNGGGPLQERQRFFPVAGAGQPGPALSARMQRYECEAAPLAAQAAVRALADAQTTPEDITHIVTVSCSGFTAPGIDVSLIRDLGLRPTTERTHVGFMGCHGALNGLRVARGFTENTPGAQVLVVAVELCTIHYHYPWDMEKNVANALFADGAAAVVLGAPREGETPAEVVSPVAQEMRSPHPNPLPPGEGTRSGEGTRPGAGNARVWRCAATGSCIIPDSEDAMTWRIRDHGFTMTLSPEVPKLIQAHLRPWMTSWLQQQELDVESIRTWAVHPGGPTILRAAGSALGLVKTDLAASWNALREFGNMSSPTLLFILAALRQQQAPTPCVLLGFGPGLAAEAVLVL